MLSPQHNVLMNDDGTPLLSDFGRSKFIDHRGFTTAFAGSARYMAPELTAAEPDIDDEALDNQVPNLTKKTDVFAFSMVVLEVSDPPPVFSFYVFLGFFCVR
jgi:serine/threonine protein kinase